MCTLDGTHQHSRLAETDSCPVARVEAGDDRTGDGTTLPIPRVLDNLLNAAGVRSLRLRCMFLSREGAVPSNHEGETRAEQLENPFDTGGPITLMQVHSVARTPADARADVLATERLEAIADHAHTLGLPAQVAPGASPACTAPRSTP